jgi:hypothetical protein
VEQAVLDHFELQLSDRTDNLTSVGWMKRMKMPISNSRSTAMN